MKPRPDEQDGGSRQRTRGISLAWTLYPALIALVLMLAYLISFGLVMRYYVHNDVVFIVDGSNKAYHFGPWSSGIMVIRSRVSFNHHLWYWYAPLLQTYSASPPAHYAMDTYLTLFGVSMSEENKATYERPEINSTIFAVDPPVTDSETNAPPAPPPQTNH